MKKDRKDLDVDTIGGDAPLTAAEEKMISDFINNQNTEKAKADSDTRAARKGKTKSK